MRQERPQSHVTLTRGPASTLGTMGSHGVFQAGEVRAQGEKGLAQPRVVTACPRQPLRRHPAPIPKAHGFPITSCSPPSV